MRAEQKRQSELIELQAAALQQFRTAAMRPSVRSPPRAEAAEQRYAYGEDQSEELMVVRSELLPLESMPFPKYGNNASQGQGSRGEIDDFCPAQRQQRRTGGDTSNVSREEGSALRRDGGRQSGARKSSQAAFGSSVATGRHKMRQS